MRLKVVKTRSETVFTVLIYACVAGFAFAFFFVVWSMIKSVN